MALSDSEDSEEESEDEGPGELNSYIAHQAAKKKNVTDFEAFGDGDENTIAEKMKTILQLRESLGMDDDVAWMAKERQKEEDKNREENMTLEEKQAASGDYMAKIREKHLQKQKAIDAQKEAEEEKKRQERAARALQAAQADDSDDEDEDDSDDEKAKKKKKKKKKEKHAEGGDDEDEEVSCHCRKNEGRLRIWKFGSETQLGVGLWGSSHYVIVDVHDFQALISLALYSSLRL